MSPTNSGAALVLERLSKAYGAVTALDDASMTLQQGEIRALMGENGAGKSTLIKCLTGAVRRDSGSIWLGGESIDPASPAHAQQLGLSTVYQEINLAPTLTVAECIALGDEARRFGCISWRAMRDRAAKALGRLGLQLDVGSPIGSHPAAVRQLVAIARALDRKAKVLVLDEPTSSLDREEVATLFEHMRRLRNDGLAILFVTHFLDQVYAVADSITVMRNGRIVGEWSTSELDRDSLVEQMLGRSIRQLERQSAATEVGKVWLRAIEFGKRRLLSPISFDLAGGEVVGLSGLLGSGRTETMKLVFGAIAADAGRLEVDGKTVSLRTPKQAIRHGMAFTPEDRKEEGIFPGLSVSDNMAIALQARAGWLRRVPTRERNELVRTFQERLGIVLDSASQPIESLSGGNQQKVILARWLALSPRLLILDEPTRGIDIGSKFDFRAEMRRRAAAGSTVLFSSAELEEIVHSSDRVLILRDRALVGELAGEAVEEDSIMRRIAAGRTA